MEVYMSLQVHVNSPETRVPLEAAGRSFLAGFVVNVLLSGIQTQMNVTKSLVGGAFSAAASLIDTAIRPMIGQLFSGYPDTELFQAITRLVVVFSILSVGATVVTPKVGIDLLASMVCYAAMSVFAGIDVNYPVVLA